jgi:hypothetical protein
MKSVKGFCRRLKDGIRRLVSCSCCAGRTIELEVRVPDGILAMTESVLVSGRVRSDAASPKKSDVDMSECPTEIMGTPFASEVPVIHLYPSDASATESNAGSEKAMDLKLDQISGRDVHESDTVLELVPHRQPQRNANSSRGAYQQRKTRLRVRRRSNVQAQTQEKQLPADVLCEIKEIDADGNLRNLQKVKLPITPTATSGHCIDPFGTVQEFTITAFNDVTGEFYGFTNCGLSFQYKSNETDLFVVGRFDGIIWTDGSRMDQRFWQGY